MPLKLISTMTGKWNEMDLPVTGEELQKWRLSGEHVQDHFPHLSNAQREFLISGVTPEEWATIPDEPDCDDEDAVAVGLD